MAIHPTVILVWTKVIGVTKSCVTAGVRNRQTIYPTVCMYQAVPHSSQREVLMFQEMIRRVSELGVGSSHQLSRMLLNTLETDNHQLIFRLLMESLLVIELEWAQVL